MDTKRLPVSIVFAAAMACTPAPAAADWAHVVQACGNAAKQNATTSSTSSGQGPSLKDVNTRAGAALISKSDKRYPWEDCVLKFIGLDPVAPVVGSLGTGGGPAAGLRAEQDINSGRVQSLLAGRGLIAPGNGSYITEAHWDVMMPSFGQWNAATQTYEDQIIISPFVRRTDLHAMPFYGLGPSTLNTSTIEYREQRTEAGALASVPLASWVTAGGGLTFLAPSIDRAPQPNFIDSQVFLRFHTPTNTRQTRYRHDARVTYESFADQGTGANSFHTLQLFVLGSYELRRSISTDDFFAERTALQNFLCQPMVGQECRAGNFVIDALVTTSFVDAGRTIPFYLQPTLGGTDRDGLDTLRGLDDFRLRAPNRMLLQAEFYKDVNAWFGLFVFADTGAVALNAGDFGSVRWHYDYGPGIFVRAGGRIALRAFLAFGGGEGVNASFKFAGGP
jgi:hypothetical protein